MQDRNETLNSYISDMIALEKHISSALKGQLNDLKEHPTVTRELEPIRFTVERHLSALEAVLNQRGGDGHNPIKKAGSAVLGAAAGVVDLVRSEGLPKNLRDDYTAFSLATIGYVMLHTTALSLGEEPVGELAREHLGDYAKVVMTLHNMIPAAVIRFLQQEGLPATDDRLEEIGENIESVWRHPSGDVSHAEGASV